MQNGQASVGGVYSTRGKKTMKKNAFGLFNCYFLVCVCQKDLEHLHAVEWHTHARPVLYNHCQMVVSSSELYIDQNLSLDCGAHEHIQMARGPYADSQRCCFSPTTLIEFNLMWFLFNDF